MKLGNTDKAYKNGIVDQSKIHAKKDAEIKKANDQVADNQRRNNEELKQGINGIYDIMDMSDKERSLGEDNSLRLSELDEYYRAYIVGTIYSIGIKNSPLSEAQQNYFNQLKIYLGVESPHEVDLKTIGQVEDIDVIKSVFKVVNEFEYLKNESWDFKNEADYKEYTSVLRLSQQDITEIEANLKKLLVFGNEALGRQYVSSSTNKKDGSNQDSSKIKETEDGNTANSMNKEYSSNAIKTDEKFEKIIKYYERPQSDFKNIGKGVEIVQKDRELLCDQLSLSIKLVNNFSHKIGMYETLSGYQDKLQQYLESAKRMAKEKEEANVASGKDSRLEKIGKIGMLFNPYGQLVITSETLLFMKRNLKMQTEYLLDLFRLSKKTLDSARKLHQAENLVAKESDDKAKYLLMSRIGQSVEVLTISYKQLPSIDFRSDNGNDSRKQTRKYLTDFFPKFNDDKRGKTGLYIRNADKADSRYLSEKEINGIFSDIMNYKGVQEEIIGAIDTTMVSSGKKGIVFLEDGLIIKDLMSKPIRIAYKDIEAVVGTRILSRNQRGNIVETNIKRYTKFINEKELELALENIKTYWTD